VIATLWRLLWNLVRDLGAPVLGEPEEELAQDDDLLDAQLDDDGMDASGL
jgi:hypothetical protein